MELSNTVILHTAINEGRKNRLLYMSIPESHYMLHSVIIEKLETGGILGTAAEGLPDEPCLVVSLYY